MPRFVSLVNYTQDGVEVFAELDGDEFLTQTEEVVEAHGGEVKDFYLTLGQYDAVIVTEFPDAEAGTTALLNLMQSGVAGTETMRAMTLDETREIIDSVSAWEG